MHGRWLFEQRLTRTEMGWIRDLMLLADAPPRSLGELGRRCLAHPGWPEEPRPKPRSLAAMLGRMDRGLDLEWLRDRPAVQQVLSEVLSCALADIQLSCRPPDAGHGPSADPMLRLDDLPFARSLRLREEALPPGIPLLPQRVSAWSAVWWYAPSGAGRSLVGRWLEARGAARWVCARHWPDAEPECHEPGPVYVELHSPRHGEALSNGAPRDKICVAAPFLPESGDWVIVRSPPVTSYLGSLISWVIERLPSDSRLGADTAAQWLHGMPRERGIVDSLGAAIGLLGLLDELGIDQLRGRTLAQLARAAIRFRTATTAGQHQLLRDQGFELLVSIVTQCLTESDEGPDVPRTEAEWQGLVPPELARSVDMEWVKASLLRAGAPVATRDLERAAARLPPGAYRSVRQLGSGGFLRANEPGERLSIAPRWLSNAARSQAVRQLLSGPAHEWGEALLVPESATLLLDALKDALLLDADPLVDRVLELEARSSPGYAAGVEALVRLIGCTPELLTELTTDVLISLWQEQAELAVRPPGRPSLPLVEYPEEVSRRCPILMRGAWYAAMWSIGERLPKHARISDPTLNPWDTGPPAAAVLDDISAWLAHVEHAPTQELLFRLGERQATRREPVHPLERPARAVVSFRAQTLSAEDLTPWSSDLFCGIGSGLGAQPAELSELVRAAVPLWLATLPSDAGAAQPTAAALPTAAHQHWLDAHSPSASLVWPQLGATELEVLLSQAQLATSRLRVPWDKLSPSQWATVARLWQLAHEPPTPTSERAERPRCEAFLDGERMLEQIPGEVIASSLAAGGQALAWPSAALARAWEAARDSLLGTLASRLDAASAPESGAQLLFDACWLLEAEPVSSDAGGLELLSERLGTLALSEQLLTPILLHLQRRVRVRGVGWRSAYEQLTALERRRRRLER